MKYRYVTAVLAVLGLALAACNGADSDDAGVAGDDGTVEVDVVMVDIDYEPGSVTVPSGSTLVVNLSNEGALEHDFHLEDGSGSDVLQAGETATVEIGPFTSSTVAWCTVPGHREAGMEFEIDVR